MLTVLMKQFNRTLFELWKVRWKYWDVWPERMLGMPCWSDGRAEGSDWKLSLQLTKPEMFKYFVKISTVLSWHIFWEDGNIIRREVFGKPLEINELNLQKSPLRAKTESFLFIGFFPKMNICRNWPGTDWWPKHHQRYQLYTLSCRLHQGTGSSPPSTWTCREVSQSHNHHHHHHNYLWFK